MIALFQLEGIEFALERQVASIFDQSFSQQNLNVLINGQGRVLIADDMGLGKTIQALGVASVLRSQWPLLIVCPSSVRYEIRKP